MAESLHYGLVCSLDMNKCRIFVITNKPQVPRFIHWKLLRILAGRIMRTTMSMTIQTAGLETAGRRTKSWRRSTWIIWTMTKLIFQQMSLRYRNNEHGHPGSPLLNLMLAWRLYARIHISPPSVGSSLRVMISKYNTTRPIRRPDNVLVVYLRISYTGAFGIVVYSYRQAIRPI
jgi:hypothetical protein